MSTNSTETESTRLKFTPAWIHSMAFMELSTILVVASSDHSLVFYDLASPNLDVHCRLLGIAPPSNETQSRGGTATDRELAAPPSLAPTCRPECASRPSTHFARKSSVSVPIHHGRQLAAVARRR